MRSTCCIQILTRSGNQAHVTELLRRNEEDHTNPPKHLLEPVLTLGATAELMLAAPRPQRHLPKPTCSFPRFPPGLQQSTWRGVNCTTFHPEH